VSPKRPKKLQYAQSNVTSRIQQLEKSLNCTLFHRIAKGVILTQEGEKLYPHAVEIVNKIDIATKEMKNIQNQEYLKIGSTESNAATRIVPFLLQLHQDYPKMQLELLTNTTKETTKLLLNYQVDIAFISGIPVHKELMVLNKIEEEMVLVESLDENTNHTYLSFKSGCAYNDFAQEYFKKTKEEYKQLEFGSYETILGCVKAGIGKSILPLSIVKALKYEDQLKIQFFSQEEAYMPTCLVCRKDYLPKIATYLKTMQL
jgi:DNA-binding transcriptional LysR family regulator